MVTTGFSPSSTVPNSNYTLQMMKPYSLTKVILDLDLSWPQMVQKSTKLSQYSTQDAEVMDGNSWFGGSSLVLKMMNGWVHRCWKTAMCLIDGMNKRAIVPQGCHQHNLNHPGQHKQSFQDSSTSSALAAIPSLFPATNSIFLIVSLFLFFIFVSSVLFLGAVQV